MLKDLTFPKGHARVPRPTPLGFQSASSRNPNTRPPSPPPPAVAGRIRSGRHNAHLRISAREPPRPMRPRAAPSGAATAAPLPIAASAYH
eukprot:scaffold12646_cov115-Isochrysis_galbana.AAC.4